MKIKTAHFDSKIFEDKLQHLSHLDFSLFIDTPPQSQDELSSINIISFQEPNEYFGLHDWVIKNKDLFNVILTWDDKVLNNCENAIFLPFGSTWLKPDQYEKNYPKTFQVSHVRGNLLKTHGHSLRFEYHDRSQNELKIPYKSWETAGIREKIDTCAIAKCELFGDSQFGVAIENTSHRGYFTEKIMELFLLKTIPVYWGCSNIGDFFNIEGIITFHNIDDVIYTLNNLDKNYYNDRIDIIEENYQKALQYIDYEQNIVNTITEIFKHNKLI
jgi:hypothetical protein